MRFHSGPAPLPPRDDAHPAWRNVLLAGATVAALCSITPWVRVQFSRLWGSHDGPPGWQSSAGFTCLCSCALVVMLTLVETDSPRTRLAARPGALMLALVSTLVVAFAWIDGPGTLRGVSATWTAWFYALGVGVVLVVTSAARRWLAIAHQRG